MLLQPLIHIVTWILFRHIRFRRMLLRQHLIQLERYTLVMAYLHAGAYGCLYAVLVVGDDQCCGQFVRLPVLDPDGGEDTAQDVRYHGFFAMCLFHLRKDDYSRLRLVPVLGREDCLHLIVEIVFLADVHHAPDDLVMVDTLHRVVVDEMCIRDRPCLPSEISI